MHLQAAVEAVILELEHHFLSQGVACRLDPHAPKLADSTPKDESGCGRGSGCPLLAQSHVAPLRLLYGVRLTPLNDFGHGCGLGDIRVQRHADQADGLGAERIKRTGSSNVIEPFATRYPATVTSKVIVKRSGEQW